MKAAAVSQELFSLREAAVVTGGRNAAGREREVRCVVTDSRQAGAGCLFVALPGSRTDGHEFIADALQRGAAAVLMRADQWESRRAVVTGAGAGAVLVRDTLAALQALARNHMRRLTGLVRIGVTGSNGKTTTKELIGTIVAASAPTVMSQGNLNSEVGLPLSCFQAGPGHAYGVFEMAMSRPGEMAVLAEIVRPDYGVITNIGAAHIGFLGSREAIAREKRDLFACYDGSQKAFIHEGERFLPLLTEGLRGKLVLFGPTTTSGYRGSEDLGLDGTLIHWEDLQIRFPLFGAHNLQNALAAISVSADLGVSSSRIKAGLEAARPLFGRSQIFRGEVTVIQDCYNANPDSLSEVLAFLGALRWPGRKAAVLGAMMELGEEAGRAHREAGLLAGRSGADAVFLLGEQMLPAAAALKESGYGDRCLWSRDMEELAARLSRWLRAGDLVLLKGSRSVELERLVPRISGRARPG